MPHSHSPRMPERAIPQTLAQYAAPITPVHSPHHSITSSVSSRTPLHTLSIHEYRKQQNTPSAQTATPTGKTLRRKAAAPALHGLERAPSVASAIRGVPQSSYRSLQPSQSAQHLQSHRSPFLSQPFPISCFDLNLRNLVLKEGAFRASQQQRRRAKYVTLIRARGSRSH